MRKTFFDDFKTLSKSAQNEKIQADLGGESSVLGDTRRNKPTTDLS